MWLCFAAVSYPWLLKAEAVGCCHCTALVGSHVGSHHCIISFCAVFFADGCVNSSVLNRSSWVPLPSRGATHSASRIPTTRTKLLINSHNPLPPPPLSSKRALVERQQELGWGGGKTDKRGEKNTKARKEDWMRERGARVEKGKNAMSWSMRDSIFCLSRIEQ